MAQPHAKPYSAVKWAVSHGQRGRGSGPLRALLARLKQPPVTGSPLWDSFGYSGLEQAIVTETLLTTKE